MTPNLRCRKSIAERVRSGDLVECRFCHHTEDPEAAREHWLYSPNRDVWSCNECEHEGRTDHWDG